MRAWMEVDARALGPRVLDFYASSLERGLAARGACDPARFVDVHHDEIARDPIAIVRRIYAQFGRSFDGAERGAIEQYAAAHPKGEHGEHIYRLEDYGLTPDAVYDRFADYCEQFAIEGRGR